MWESTGIAGSTNRERNQHIFRTERGTTGRRPMYAVSNDGPVSPIQAGGALVGGGVPGIAGVSLASERGIPVDATAVVGAAAGFVVYLPVLAGLDSQRIRDSFDRFRWGIVGLRVLAVLLGPPPARIGVPIVVGASAGATLVSGTLLVGLERR